MPKMYDTQITPMRIRTRLALSTNEYKESPKVNWIEPCKQHRGEAFMRNLAVAASLVLCAVTLRTGAVPPLDDSADAILTAATDNSLLDEKLGKLSFVSALFPEAVLVFGDSSFEEIAMPVSGGVVVHAWSEDEPYLSWRTDSTQVTSAVDGEVSGIFHGNDDELLLQITNAEGMSCLYGNLANILVQTGDLIKTGDTIGTLLNGEDCVFEIRQDGISIDPTLYLPR